MKTLKIAVSFIFLLSFLGCDKDDSKDLTNVNVEEYVALLKAGRYNSTDLPNFTSNDIPALLAYGNKTQLITNFPANPISSMGNPNCTLGMYILWTIESIRAVSIESEYLIGRFPSQNPVVQQTEEPYNVERNNEVQDIVANAYKNWWENNKQKSFNEFKAIDPLEDTGYRWH